MYEEETGVGFITLAAARSSEEGSGKDRGWKRPEAASDGH
jgi:hypothetical protein